MRLVRFNHGGDVAYGALAPEGVIHQLAGHPFADPRPSGVTWPVPQVRLLAPIIPSKVVAIGKNYADHAAEMGSQPPSEPLMFLKPSTSVIGPDDPIRLPPQSQRVDFEGELAVVVGRLCRNVAAKDAAASILGYTCANDVTARDLQERDGQWARAKGFDTFCPIGPWIETDPAFAGPGAAPTTLTTRVNTEVRQQSSTSNMIHPVADLIAYVSSVMTLLPGDVILTGTPAGIGPLQSGDVVEVHIDGIGTLRNPVAEPQQGVS